MPAPKAASAAAVLAGMLTAATTAVAGPPAFTDARAFAMAGTGVAIANPAAAGFANPAILSAQHAYQPERLEFIAPSVNARLADGEDAGGQIDDIQRTIDRIAAQADDFDPDEARGLVGQLRRQLHGFDRDAARLDAAGGLGVAFPRGTVSVGVFVTASLRGTVRGELDEEDDALLAALETATEEDLRRIDLQRDLRSRGEVLAASIVETGVSIARPFELPNGETIHLGIAPKHVQLRTYQYAEDVAGFDDDDFTSRDNQTRSSHLNVDLGAAYAFGPDREWNVGAVVRNLVPMRLDSAASRPHLERKRTLRVGPRVTAGLGYHTASYILTAELDLTEQQAFGFEDDTRWLAFAAEFPVADHTRLRAGIRHNLASNRDNDGIEEVTQFTFGAGVSLFGARLDAAGLLSGSEAGGAIELGAAF